MTEVVHLNHSIALFIASRALSSRLRVMDVIHILKMSIKFRDFRVIHVN